jgi:hypothetical protein
MANFRGMDGSVRFSANVVGEVKDWQMTASIEELDDTVMGDSWATVVGGISQVDRLLLQRSWTTATPLGRRPSSTSCSLPLLPAAARHLSCASAQPSSSPAMPCSPA